MGERLQQIKAWLSSEIGLSAYEIEPASADASFRRYFRVTCGDQSQIVMDAPPDKEDLGPFITIGKAMFEVGLNVPEIRAVEVTKGFLLLSDLGARQYLSELNDENAERLYGDALGALLTLQAGIPCDADFLPAYDETLLMFEMGLFEDWFLGKHLGISLETDEQQALQVILELLTQSALEQPQVMVHRDYHSRNLMITDQHNPGILDFQDAVSGPITYDLVSLLKDSYIAWPRDKVEDWALGYHDLAIQSGVLHESLEDEARWLRWFDFMGAQRQLKVLGIFARLYHRDGKSGYVNDMPQTLEYLLDVSGRYEELAPLHSLLETRVKLPDIGR